MENKSFTLLSGELGGVATLRFAQVGCGGENISPALNWINTPAGTKSFALVLHDVDAPTPGGFWHWLMFDIPADITELASGAGDESGNYLPEGAIQSINDGGVTGYVGPYPPEGHGWHTYMFTLHALDVDSLGLTSSTPAGAVGFNIWAHTIEKCSLVFYYKN